MFRLPRKRALILGGALLVTVVASVWPRPQEDRVPEVVAPVTPRASTPQREQTVPAPSDGPTLGARRERQQTPPEVRDLFGARTWNPPPPPRTQRTPPPAPPMAPPFPYAISGSVVDASGVMVVFTSQQQSFVVRVGDVLEQTYRVESIDPQAVTVTYLPLGLMQRVPTGAVN